jgi:hypothetical protein
MASGSYEFQIVGGSGLMRPLVFLKARLVVEDAIYASEPQQLVVATTL